ncbi:MAG TPA: hypothetical protein VGB24_04520 [Longimicrobium sp.]|jgi:hypothetical protein|uniref:CIS tube protein n=1 Tax=Longimicrobium sp. TaxID=2029185 RepID=UPI002EDBB121
MPQPGKLEKATLTEMWPGSDNELKAVNATGGTAKKVTVQFNPQSLKLTFSNQNAGGSQPAGAVQFVGQSTTKLSLELWFDVTLPIAEGQADPKGDVRNLTKEIAYFMTPQKVTQKGQTGLLPPAVEFHWGSFLFKGTIDSMDETLELFSETGKPLRAGMQLSLSKQNMSFEFGKPGTPGTTSPGGGGGPGGGGVPGAGPAAGTQPLAMAKAGDTIQGASARLGVGDWKAMAVANGIENPRMVSPGALLNVSGSVSGSGAEKLGLTGATSLGASASAGVSASAQSSGSITVAGSGSGSSGLSAAASLRFTGPSGPKR